MTKRVLIIGGYGNFGSFIARWLSKEKDITVIIGGRSKEKAVALAKQLNCESAQIDITHDIDAAFERIKPDIVIHTSGPFQNQGYGVAEACIRHKSHYIDIADGREFVSNISKLDVDAKQADVLIASGASSVPSLTAAIIDKYKQEFQTLESVDYGIATAQKTARGLATTEAVLSYAGKPFDTLINGQMKTVYGWQGLHAHKFPNLGWRLLGNCDVPDLTIFPKRYPELKTIRFYAGLELPFVHLALWKFTWLVRIKLINNLSRYGGLLLKIASLFDFLGDDKSAFYMRMRGKTKEQSIKEITFDLTARKGNGPYIPCTPAILLALKFARNNTQLRGASPCVGMIHLDELLAMLATLDISWTLSYEGEGLRFY